MNFSRSLAINSDLVLLGQASLGHELVKEFVALVNASGDSKSRLSSLLRLFNARVINWICLHE